MWIQKISSIFPTTYVFEGMRYAFEHGKILWNNLIISLGLNIILLFFACLFFSKSIEFARRKGLFVKRE